MIGFIKKYLSKKKMRIDKEYKEAVHYAYQHYKGEELDIFLKTIDSIYDGDDKSVHHSSLK